MSSSPKVPQQQQQRARQRKPLKIVVVGSASVGKTSILRQFVYKTYDPKSTQTTIGCDFWHRNLTVIPPAGFTNNNNPNSTPSTSTPSSPVRNNNNSNNNTVENSNGSSSPPQSQPATLDVSLQVWDTAGMDTGFQSLAPSFFRGADGALLVYDLTSSQSFEHAKTWRDMFVTHAGHHAPILLVGNKLDLTQDRKIKREDAENFVRQSTEARQRLAADSSNNSSFSSDAAGGGSNGGGSGNGGGGIMVCGAVELTASDADAVEKAFIQLTTAMLEVEKSRAATEVVSQQDLKRVRLGSVANSEGRDGSSSNSGNNNGKNCKC